MPSFAWPSPGRASSGLHALIRCSASVVALTVAVGCQVRTPPPDAGRNDGGGPDVPLLIDVPREDTPPDTSYDAPIIVDPDAACAVASAPAIVERAPVDIIWVVDNSGSMVSAIEEVQDGLDAFATELLGSGLDYRLILLSLRTPTSGRFPVCIPEPLAGPDCADGDRFFQIDVDIKSTQPVEQILGTLAQTIGYRDGETAGGPPWRHLLRDGATKTIVVVTDDNARVCSRTGGGTCLRDGTHPVLTETSLEDYIGGLNPYNGSASNERALGPGLLTATYGDLFEGYTFNAIYGYGSETDEDLACDDGYSPGWTYTALVERTGGVRAQLCDGPAAWGPFFDAVASTVLTTSRIECEVTVPPPPDEMVLVPSHVNVNVRGASATTLVPRVLTMGACDPVRGGWYYDDNTTPTRIFLCPTSCDFAREEIVEEGTGLDVVFGCESIVL